MNITCYDSTNKPIKELTQWDTNRKIIITGVEVESAPVIHFYNIKSDKALVVPSTFSDSSITVSIPNILLQSHFPLIISIYSENGDEGKTVGTACIPIVPKKKPEDYEYVENIEYVSWVELKQELEKIRNKIIVAEDDESIIIGGIETNVAGTKGFIISKATRETQQGGNYHYFYYLVKENIEQTVNDTIPYVTQIMIREGDNETPFSDSIYSKSEFLPIYDIQYTDKLSVKIAETDIWLEIYLSEAYDGKIKESQLFSSNKLTLKYNEETNEIKVTLVYDVLEALQYVLTKYPNTTNTLRTCYINKEFKLKNEYAEDYFETYEAIDEGQYIKVRVSGIRKTYKNVPDSGEPEDEIKDEQGNWRYIWKPTEDEGIYEIDYTDTWNYTVPEDEVRTKYSYFRLSVAPELGTEWLKTNGVVLGGHNNQVLGSDSVVGGTGNIVNGAKAAVFGDDNYGNSFTFIGGRKNKVLDKSGSSLGEQNTVHSYGATAIGVKNDVTGYVATAIGENLKTKNAFETLVGRYNDITKEKVRFAVGTGWDDNHRYNGLTVYTDGRVETQGELTAAGLNVNKKIAELDSKVEGNTDDIASLCELTKELGEETNILKESIDAMQDSAPFEYINQQPTTEVGKPDKIYIYNNKDANNKDATEQYIYRVRKPVDVSGLSIWDGTKPESKPEKLKGSGTESDPYQITNGTELYWVIFKTILKHSKLMNDIVLNELNDINWQNGEHSRPVNQWGSINNIAGKLGYGYSGGYLDGQNHTIYGLYYAESDTNTAWQQNVGSALFPMLNNNFSVNPLVIKNLGLDYAYIRSCSNAGALVAYNQSANYEVKNCYIGENVTLSGKRMAAIGTYGNGKATIENCYSLAQYLIYTDTTHYAFAQASWWKANPTGTTEVGTKKVEDNKINISHCYDLNNKIVTSNTNIDDWLIVEDCYCTEAGGKGTVISKDDMMGISALNNMVGLGDAFISDYSYPHLVSFAEGWKNIGNNKIVNPDIVKYLNYKIVDNKVAIIGYKEGLPSKVIIPDFIDGCPVTSIGDEAFYDCDSLKSVTIPDSVTSIGTGAFAYCSSLKSTTIPDSVTSIGGFAFGHCTSLASITIPDSVTNIRINAFYNCSSLTSVTIPDSVTSINERTFYDCSSLTSVTIPASVTIIRENAFYGCNKLTDVYYHESQEDKNITIATAGNVPLNDATWHYNYSFDSVYNVIGDINSILATLVEGSAE